VRDLSIEKHKSSKADAHKVLAKLNKKVRDGGAIFHAKPYTVQA
jgi:hypothetical protein